MHLLVSELYIYQNVRCNNKKNLNQTLYISLNVGLNLQLQYEMEIRPERLNYMEYKKTGVGYDTKNFMDNCV